MIEFRIYADVEGYGMAEHSVYRLKGVTLKAEKK